MLTLSEEGHVLRHCIFGDVLIGRVEESDEDVEEDDEGESGPGLTLRRR